MQKKHHIPLLFLFFAFLLCCACQWSLKQKEGQKYNIRIERYDRIESQYLTSGDFAALQQMNLEYPTETRTLIEDVLKLGKVNEPDINITFLNFYQDTTLQQIINAVNQQYANIDDINAALTKSFSKLAEMLPGLKIPKIYTQIGALDQSIVVSTGEVGISLDKYLGKDYPLYKTFYNKHQRDVMTRSMIVPDCIVFYLISLYPMATGTNATQMEHDIFMARILWVANKAMEQRTFTGHYTDIIESYVRKTKAKPEELLKNNDYNDIVTKSEIKYR